MFAIVKIAGKQYTVSPDDTLEVNHLEAQEGETVTFPEVLLTDVDGNVSVGTPHLEGLNVRAIVMKQGKGEKLNVRRYKSKVRYRKSIGFRPLITQIKITAIG